jgi:ribosomal protein S18 acetylase RimI-like enzyme
LDAPGDIRLLRREDRGPVLRLVEETGVFTPAEVSIAAELIDIALERPDQTDYLVHVLEEKGPVIGYTCVGPTPGTEGTYDMYWIAVARAAQGHGVGARLDRHARELIRARGGRLIIVETSSRPDYGPTRAFYERRGYRTLARIADYYRPGDDLVIYGLSLVS